jgi:hypothetical protein
MFKVPVRKVLNAEFYDKQPTKYIIIATTSTRVQTLEVKQCTYDLRV